MNASRRAHQQNGCVLFGIVLITLLWGLWTIVSWNNVRIDYYGQVIDQDDRPVAGVKVRYSIQRLYFFFVGVGGSYFREVTTDANGLFVISGERGDGLGFTGMTKDGFKYSQKGSRGQIYFGGGAMDYKPDRKRPEIFTMVQYGTADPLIPYNIHLAIPRDGTPVRINAMTGKAAADGDLQITLKREPYNIVFGGPHFSWSVKIEVIDGGLVELAGYGTYRAPQEGYRREFVHEESSDSPKWGGGIRETFYIRMRDNRYGRINLRLNADRQPPPTVAFLEAYINLTAYPNNPVGQ